MTQASFPTRRAARWMLAMATASIATASSQVLNAQTTSAPPPPPAMRPDSQAAGFSSLQGVVLDSVHNVPLARANVLVEGTNRSGLTDAGGRYEIDSIPVGSHHVIVLHQLLDTMGVIMRTQAFPFGPGERHSLDLAVPAGPELVRKVCPAARIAMGPGVMLGFVRDPDTNAPAPGVKVELVYETTDLAGRKASIVRSAMSDSSGAYRICGIPGDMTGKVQVFRNGVSSGEVPVEANNFVALRAFGIVARANTVAQTTDSGTVKRVAVGHARIVGKVVDKLGKPLAGARIVLQGGGTMTVSGPNGTFTLDSLPAGTQAIEVRKLGYAATDQPVELSSLTPAHTTVTLGDFVPTLAVMRTEAARDKALSDIGYLERKKSSATGFFMDGDQINHDATSFSDVMRAAPGLRISPTGDGRTYTISDTRGTGSSGGGCVNYYVDGTQWQSLQPGDIDDYVKPSELVAIEVYHGSGTPPQYTSAGQSSCATIVAWTVARVRPKNP